MFTAHANVMVAVLAVEPSASAPATSQDRSWLAEAAGLWPVLLVALGLAIVLATAWLWWRSKGEKAGTDAAASADELRRLAQQVADDLDAKADRLAMLIKHADRRIKALSELAEGVPGTDEARVVTRAGGGRTREPAAVRGAVNDPIAEQVYQMADSGLTPVQIAQKLSQPTGNVELMLALRR
jgi:hypothetical protein